MFFICCIQLLMDIRYSDNPNDANHATIQIANEVAFYRNQTYTNMVPEMIQNENGKLELLLNSEVVLLF